MASRGLLLTISPVAVAAPYQAVDRGEIGAAGFRCQPVAHRVFVLAYGDSLQRRRHGQRLFR